MSLRLSASLQSETGPAGGVLSLFRFSTVAGRLGCASEQGTAQPDTSARGKVTPRASPLTGRAQDNCRSIGHWYPLS